MKIFNLALLFFSLLYFSSCTAEDRWNEPSSVINITGNWKIDHYEVKGKNYQVSGCDVNDQISINADKTGKYLNSEINVNTNDCYKLENIAGKWTLKSSNTILALEYNANNTVLFKTFQVESISNKELRLVNAGKIITGAPSADGLIEIWLKD